MKLAHLSDAWWLALIVLAALAFWLRHQRQKPAIISQIVGKSRWRQAFGEGFLRRQARKNRLYAAALILMAIAILRPQWDQSLREVSRQGVDIMFVVDVSLSMNAGDLKPSRLERAEREIKDLVTQLQGDRVGLISFAGGSFLQCPLTLDYGSFRLFLDELSPGMIPIPGTDISSALEMAAESFRKDSGKSKVVVLITDGEDHGDKGKKAAAVLTEQGIHLYVVSFGTEQGAPMVDPQTGHYLKEAGQLVISKPDFAALDQLASAAGGSLYRSTGEHYGVAKAYTAIKAEVANQALTGGKKFVYREAYAVFLGLALILLLADSLLSHRKILVPLLALALWPCPDALLAQPAPTTKALGQSQALSQPQALAPHPPGPKIQNRQGDGGAQAFLALWRQPVAAIRHYRAGRLPESFAGFLAGYSSDDTRQHSERSGFNLAATAYRQGRYSAAKGLLQKFIATTPWNGVAKALLHYNLGNTLVAMGQLDGALKAYGKALELDPQLAEASANREYTAKLKAFLDSQNPKNNQNKQGKDQQKNQQKNQEQQGKDQQKNKDKQGKDGQNQPKPGENADQQQKPADQDGKAKPEDQEQAKDKKPKSGKPDDKDPAGKGQPKARSWQDQAALDKRNSERLLDSIKEDRRQYLRRRMPKPRGNAEGGKRW